MGCHLDYRDQITVHDKSETGAVKKKVLAQEKATLCVALPRHPLTRNPSGKYAAASDPAKAAKINDR